MVSFLGLSGLLLAGFVVGVLLVARKYIPQVNRLPLLNAVPVASGFWLGLGILAFVAFSAGWFASFGLTPATIEQGGVFGGLCADGFISTPAGCVSSQIYGSSATLTLTGQDWGTGAKVASSTINTSVYDIQDNQRLRNSVTYSAGDSEITVPVGHQVSTYVIDAAAYYAYPEPKSYSVRNIDAAAKTYDVDAIKVVDTEANFAITAYDSTMTALSASDNTTNADYKISLGADEVQVIKFKVYQGDADTAYDFDAIAVAYWNYTVAPYDFTDDAGGSYTQVACPSYITNVPNVIVNGTEVYDTCFQRNEPLRLTEYEDVIVTLKIKGGSSDPVSPSADPAKHPYNGYAFLVLDSAWFTGQDGMPKYDFKTDGSSQLDPGFVETYSSPLGKDTGFILEVD